MVIKLIAILCTLMSPFSRIAPFQPYAAHSLGFRFAMASIRCQQPKDDDNAILELIARHNVSSDWLKGFYMHLRNSIFQFFSVETMC